MESCRDLRSPDKWTKRLPAPDSSVILAMRRCGVRLNVRKTLGGGCGD